MIQLKFYLETVIKYTLSTHHLFLHYSSIHLSINPHPPIYLFILPFMYPSNHPISTYHASIYIFLLHCVHHPYLFTHLNPTIYSPKVYRYHILCGTFAIPRCDTRDTYKIDASYIKSPHLSYKDTHTYSSAKLKVNTKEFSVLSTWIFLLDSCIALIFLSNFFRN